MVGAFTMRKIVLSQNSMAVMERDCWLSSPPFECCRRKLCDRESFTAMLMFAPSKNKLGIRKESENMM
jgi:hypothetical protein